MNAVVINGGAAIKNQTFTVHGRFENGGTNAGLGLGVSIAGHTISARISKDGAQFVNCTNAASVITPDAGGNGWSRGWAKVILTADEMNADRIVIEFADETSATSNPCVVIYTTSSSGGGGATAAEVWDYATRTLTSSGSGGISLDDTITEGTEIPGGTITLRQVFQLIAKRLKRTGHRI